MSTPPPDYGNTPVTPNRPRFDYVLYRNDLEPVVTIITPFYNTGPVFAETAQSIWQQSLQQWEWLIVNDASDRPEALAVLESYRQGDPRVRVIDLESNQGPSASRNMALQEARSDLVFLLDSDDLIEPTTLEKLAWYLESHPEHSFCKGYTVAFGGQEYLSTAGFETRDLFLSLDPITPRVMIRRQVALSVGGFDATLTEGLEDWEFWLHCAAEGHWGATVPEFLDWYRRRADHSDRWAAWTSRGVRKMRRELERRYPALYERGIPVIPPRPQEAFGPVPEHIPFANPLQKQKTRLLLVIPWMAMGGADKFNLDLIVQLQRRGYEISVVTTLPDNYRWYQEFAALTPDIFVLPHFLHPSDYPRFLLYLVRSRQIDIVLISNSQLGYKLLPFLRSRCPEIAFADYCHIEEEYWNSGGHPRMSVGYREMLDATLVTSDHLKSWMVDRGGQADSIQVCYVNVDTQAFSPDPESGRKVRRQLGIRPGVPLLVYAGRLCEQKQPRVFAAVMNELQVRELDFVCLVAGDGEERRWLRSYLRRRRLTRKVRMLGAVSNQRLRELLSAADIFFSALPDGGYRHHHL